MSVLVSLTLLQIGVYTCLCPQKDVLCDVCKVNSLTYFQKLLIFL